VTRWLSVEEVRSIHDAMVNAPLIDAGKLEGAVRRPYDTFNEKLLYTSIYSQASVLMHSLCRAHAFLDGNKRTAWVSAMTFLELNGVHVRVFGQLEMADYMEQVALGVHSEEETGFFLAAITIL
jgi:death on curing protein